MRRLNVDLEELYLSDESYEDEEQMGSQNDEFDFDEEDDSSAVDDDASEEDDQLRVRSVHRRHYHNRRARSQESLSTTSTFTDSELSNSEIESTDTSISHCGELSRRRQFTKQISRLESEADVKILYPLSLQPGQDTFNGDDHERQILEEFAELGVLVDDVSYHDGFNYEELHNVSVYRSLDHPNGLAGQLEALQTVASEKRDALYLLDGDLRRGNVSKRLVGVQICCPNGINIGALMKLEQHTAREDIWLQTVTGGQEGDTWYKIRSPSTEYASLFEQSLWFADLLKHVTDFCSSRAAEGNLVGLIDFAESFSQQIHTWHGHDRGFLAWIAACDEITDFRKHVLRNATFLWDHSYSLGEAILKEHPLWHEIGAVDVPDEDLEVDVDDEKTVVTSSVEESFLKCFPKWGQHAYDLLEAVPYARDVAARREVRRKALSFPKEPGLDRQQTFCQVNMDEQVSKASLFLEEAALANHHTTLALDEIVGKIIVVKRTPKQGREPRCDYAWASALSMHKKKVRVIWLLKPSMTACGDESDGTYYPVGTELFFDQDRCPCTDTVLAKDIFGVFGATILGVDYGTNPQLFVRQSYSKDNQTISIASESSLRCRHRHRQSEDQAIPHDRGIEEGSLRKLRTLSMFAGCGLLDYSLVDSGFFEIVQAIDLNKMAINSHKLNAKANNCEYHVESVDRRLRMVLTGQVPATSIDCIVAGSPCQGFSTLNKFKHNLRGQKNCSMLAATIAAIEVHLPLFAMIENVPAMDSANPQKRRGNACAQAICHLVALGYQVRKMILPAQCYGASTRRKRLFLIAAAPQMKLPDLPLVTHGDSFDLEDEVHVCDVLDDLDPIDEHIALNTRRPDHVPILRLKARRHDRISLRNVVQRIPTNKPGQGLTQSYEYLTREQKKWFKTLSKSQRGRSSTTLRRVDPDKPFQTIVTIASPLDGQGSGCIVHPTEHRIMSLEEFRRAQGARDSFLLAGSMNSQLHQLGNGVPWQLGANIGTSVGQAWGQSSQNVIDLERLSAEQETSQQYISDNTTALTTSEPLHSSDEQLQRELEETLEVDRDSSALSAMGDTIVYRPVSPTSPEADKLAMDADRSLEDLHAGVVKRIRSDIVGVPVPEATKVKVEDKFERSESASPIPAGRRKSSTLSTATPDSIRRPSLLVVQEDIVEISEHEFLDVKPSGEMKFERSHRETFTRKYTQRRRRPSIVVEVPMCKKRSVPVSEPSDDDVVYVKTQPAGAEFSESVTSPAAKRARLDTE